MSEKSERTAARADKGCDRIDWLTPPDLLLPIQAFCGGQITLDPCSDPGNHTGALYYLSGNIEFGRIADEDNGLVRRWCEFEALQGTRFVAYVNPPYGKVDPTNPHKAGTRAWVEMVAREVREGHEALFLISAADRCNSIYFQEAFFDGPLDAMLYHRRRVDFMDPSTGEVATNNPGGSILYGFNVSLSRFKRYFSHLGRVLPGSSVVEFLPATAFDVAQCAAGICGGTGIVNTYYHCGPCERAGRVPAELVARQKALLEAHRAKSRADSEGGKRKTKKPTPPTQPPAPTQPFVYTPSSLDDF